MIAFDTLTATAVALPGENIDTDQILPAKFLKVVSREGLAQGLFYNLRFDEQDRPRPQFLLNQPPAAAAQIFVAGANFGCGSSREHAPWALLDWGFRVVVAPSFADIFYNNSLNSGLLPAIVPQEAHGRLLASAADGRTPVRVDLQAQTLRWNDDVAAFAIGPGPKRKLALGLDMVGETLLDLPAIAAFEDTRPQKAPWVA